MKFKAYTGITWSLLELTSLVEDEDSHVHLERVKKHFGLHPFHLTNLHAALNEILSSNLNFYDTELKGFPLAYKNPKVITPLGEVLYDTCFIHVDIEVDFYVFRPQLEIALKGIVNKKGLNHIGVLVHKAFNVSIPSPEDVDEWVGSKTEIGHEVKFIITHLDFNSRLPFIRGVLDENHYLQQYKPVKKKETDCTTEETPASKKQSKSKNKSRKLSWMSPDENNDMVNGHLESTKKEIKKRSKKTSKEPLKKETQVPDEDTPVGNGKSKKRGKKLIIKSKELCSSSESENDFKQNDIKLPERVLQNNISEYSEHDENDANSIPKRSPNKFNDSASLENVEKSSSKKRSKKSKLSDVKLEFDIDKIKPDPEATIETGKKVKLKSRSKSKNGDVDDSMQDDKPDECSKTLKKQSKKSKFNSHEEENDVRVKTEDIEYDGEALKITATPKKRRSKLKHSFSELDTDENEEKPSVEVIKKQAKKSREPSMILDYDDVTVKNEKLNDSVKNVKNGTEQKTSKAEQLDETGNKPEKQSKIKSKKLARNCHNMSDTESDYASVEVKSEDLDNTMPGIKREHVFHSPANVTMKKKVQRRSTFSPKDSPTDRGDSNRDSISKHGKKRKPIDFDLNDSDLEIKRERSVSVKREETDNDSTNTESTRVTPKKQSRKRKSSTVDATEDYFMPVKTEKVESDSFLINSEEEAYFDKYSPKKITKKT